MVLTAFGMAGSLRSAGRRRFEPGKVGELPKSAWEPDEGGRELLCQGPVNSAGPQRGAERTLVTGWIDPASVPGADIQGDLPALQHLLDERGAAGVRGLRGDFVLAHLDRNGAVLRLYRAVNALVPLFWRGDRRFFAWAADPALLLVDGTPRLSDVDDEMLPMIIAEKGLPHDRSWFADVHRLPTGQCLTLRAGSDPEVRGFDGLRPISSPPATIGQAADGLRDRLGRSVGRMLSDGSPAILMLSGGIDSAAIADEVGRRSGGTGLHLTLRSFPGHDADREIAEATAHTTGLKWVPYDMAEHVRVGGDYLDGTPPGALPQTHVPRRGVEAVVEQARATGATFVLSGLLADQALAHDLQRGLLQVAGFSMLNPAVAGEPIWHVLGSAARSAFSESPEGSAGSWAAVRYLGRMLAGDPTTALPARDRMVHPVGFTEQAGRRVTEALREAAERTHHDLRSALGSARPFRRAVPVGMTAAFMLADAFNTANLQAAWLNHCMPARRIFAAPYADREFLEYALALPGRHRLGFGHGLTVDKFALRLAYTGRGLPARLGSRTQQATITSVPATFANQNFEVCRRLLRSDSLLCEAGVLSREFVTGLHPGRVHRNGEEIARLCVVEQWLEGLV